VSSSFVPLFLCLGLLLSLSLMTTFTLHFTPASPPFPSSPLHPHPPSSSPYPCSDAALAFIRLLAPPILLPSFSHVIAAFFLLRLPFEFAPMLTHAPASSPRFTASRRRRTCPQTKTSYARA
jgi:hypothetical protein